MGRIKIGTSVLPIQLRDVITPELLLPKTKNPLGVGLTIRGTKLDHWRTYSCNGKCHACFRGADKTFIDSCRSALALRITSGSPQDHSQRFVVVHLCAQPAQRDKHVQVQDWAPTPSCTLW